MDNPAHIEQVGPAQLSLVMSGRARNFLLLSALLASIRSIQGSASCSCYNCDCYVHWLGVECVITEEGADSCWLLTWWRLWLFLILVTTIFGFCFGYICCSKPFHGAFGGCFLTALPCISFPLCFHFYFLDSRKNR